jgi:hypothetical protein
VHKKAALVLSLGVMALAAWAAISAMAWPLKAKLFPLGISIPLFCLAAAEFAWLLLGSSQKGEVMDFQLADHLPAAVARRRTLLATGWILGFTLAIVLLGFPIAVPAFVFLYLRLQGREGWILSAVCTAAVWAVFYGLFDQLLHLPFPAGWLLSSLGFG